MKTIERLKQGCGELDIHVIEGDEGQEIWLKCGDFKDGLNECSGIELCPICQAKLSQYQEDVEEFKKLIKGLFNKKRTDRDYVLKAFCDILLEELDKSSLNDNEKEIGGNSK